MKREPMRIYDGSYDCKPFKFEHCWEIIIKNTKWCSKELTMTNEMKKQKMCNKGGSQPLPKETHRSNSNEGEDDVHVINNIEAECRNSDEIERPQGRKACKEKKRRLNEDKIMVDTLKNLQSTLEKQIRVQKEELESEKKRKIGNILNFDGASDGKRDRVKGKSSTNKGDGNENEGECSRIKGS